MSEVVPLPSFGEVFFDARGQERVLRVTWHEGTLVLSLWRGEMCTASFRMPLEDVDRLLDTLDEGFAEASGVAPEEGEDGGYAEEGGYPGTGQYVRPEGPPQGHYDAETQVSPAVEERSAPTVGPNDVLVARGAERPVGGYPGPGEVVPRENMIVGDALPYGQADAEPVYQMPGGPFRSPAASAPPRTDPHGFAAQSAQSAQPAHAADPGYGSQPLSGPHTGSYGTPPQQRPAADEPYDMPGRQAPDPYGRQADPYGGPGDSYPGLGGQSADPYAARPRADQAADPFAGTTYGTPRGARAEAPAEPYAADPYASDGYAGDGYGADAYAQQQHYGPGDPGTSETYGRRRRPEPSDAYPGRQYGTDAGGSYGQPHQHGVPPDPYGVPADPYGAAGPQAQAYGSQGGPLDAVDPLGMRHPGGADYAQPDIDTHMPRPYVPDQMYTTGERMRPEQEHGGYGDPGYDRQYDEPGYDQAPEPRGERGGRGGRGERRGERRRRGERHDW
ncbi:hypothetical protein [Sinosporangium album]|uniref:hypothetical protein n=1 Tax=Sinosporangium album TaxID=504805 RepID=UPI00115FE024|nr:hypothetical protein [Sinosporangium album]